jgi:hypothetical protein
MLFNQASNNILNSLKTENGKKVLSIILGLGIASMFRKVCTQNNCLIINGPNPKETNNISYKMNGDESSKNKCYIYKRYPINCPIKKDKL